MRWPLVSRSSLDLALEQLALEQQRVTQLLDALVRLQRHEMGLPERPTEAKPRPEPMPEAVRELIRGFDSPALVEDFRKRALAIYREVGNWAYVEQEIRSALGE